MASNSSEARTCFFELRFFPPAPPFALPAVPVEFRRFRETEGFRFFWLGSTELSLSSDEDEADEVESILARPPVFFSAG